MKLNHKEHRENAEEQFEQQSHGYEEAFRRQNTY
jgi:hypothetical protein